MVMAEVMIPIRTVSEMNSHAHWRGRYRRSKEQRLIVTLMLRSVLKAVPTVPCRVTLTRYGPRRLDPDNLASSHKWVQDATAEFLGVDDGDERLEWVYEQAKAKTPSVGIRFEPLDKPGE